MNDATDCASRQAQLSFAPWGGRPEILLVQAKKRPAHWSFPKGHIGPGERADTATLREVREEAGVLGRVVRPLCPPLTFQSGDEPVCVQYYLVVATGETEPVEARNKKWIAPDGALQKLTHCDAQRMLRTARFHETPRLSVGREAPDRRRDSPRGWPRAPGTRLSPERSGSSLEESRPGADPWDRRRSVPSSSPPRAAACRPCPRRTHRGPGAPESPSACKISAWYSPFGAKKGPEV